MFQYLMVSSVRRDRSKPAVQPAAVRGLAILTLVAVIVATAPGAQAGMIKLNWQFNDSLGDASGTGNDGTYYDAASGSPVYVQGVFGNGINLDPKQMVWRGYATNATLAPANAALSEIPTGGTDAWTVNLWVNAANDAPATHTAVGGFGTDPSGTSLAGTKRYIRVKSDATPVSKPITLWGNSSTYDYSTGVSFTGNADNWHMLTASYTGATKTLRMYLDGVQLGADYIPGFDKATEELRGLQSITTADSNFMARVGGDNKSPPTDATTFDGVVDDFSIWNVGLESGEVKALAAVPGCGVAELLGYDAASMEKLIGVYRAGGTESGAVGALTWEYTAGLTGHKAGEIWKDAATGYYYMQFGGDFTSGVGVVATPEPATMALLAASLLLPAWRRRRRS